jgi:hypothetical protein
MLLLYQNIGEKGEQATLTIHHSIIPYSLFSMRAIGVELATRCYGDIGVALLAQQAEATDVRFFHPALAGLIVNIRKGYAGAVEIGFLE